MAVNLADPTWDMIVKKITDGTCILVTGPNIGLTDPSKSINAMLNDFLNSIDNVKHYADDEFFSFSNEGEKEKAIFRIQNYYKDLKPRDVHYKIADIPFKLMISVSPDNLLKNVFVEKKIAHTFDFYNKEQNPAPLEKPTPDKPLIYNLFGDIENEGSLIFTYDDLFDYLIKIFGDFKLPQTLQNELKMVRHVLFLGFDFDKWYFKLLLRLIKVHEIKIKNASNKDKNLMPAAMNFYLDEFKMEFIEYNEMDILDTIYKKCEEIGVLRTKTIPQFNTTSDVYISYAWGGESGDIATSIDEELAKRGLNIIRDKKNLGYTDNIKNFMKAIGKGKYVIVIISDKYLRSDYCMYELLEISKNGDIYNRIFPIVLNDANIYDYRNRIEYTNYWARKKGDLNDMLNSMEDKTGSRQIIDQLDQVDDIKKFFVEISTTLGNMNALTPDMHKQSDFSELISALEQKIQQDNK